MVEMLARALLFHASHHHPKRQAEGRGAHEAGERLYRNQGPVPEVRLGCPRVRVASAPRTRVAFSKRVATLVAVTSPTEADRLSSSAATSTSRSGLCATRSSWLSATPLYSRRSVCFRHHVPIPSLKLRPRNLAREKTHSSVAKLQFVARLRKKSLTDDFRFRMMAARTQFE